MFRATSLIPILAITIIKLNAQEVAVSAIIRDAETDQPLPGVEIIVGSGGTITDARGEFSIIPGEAQMLSLRHIGYQTLEVPVSKLGKIIYLIPEVIQGGTVIVSGGLSRKALLDIEAGVTVLRTRQLQTGGTEHFQNLINRIPNLTWAGGSSRPRYFQIRGIGERSQYAGDGPPNFSVGFSIDDIDLSGMAMAGMTFDLESVELFRGPQSSVYGPNAIGGFINLRSLDPMRTSQNVLQLSMGNADTRSAGLALDLPIATSIKGRLALQRSYNNGFRENVYLNSDHTNERQESLARLKLHWIPDSRVSLQTTVMVVELDNGYDSWAPDNNGYTSYADKPGRDSQMLTAGSLKGTLELSPELELLGIASLSRSESEHSYDSDWGNEDFWADEPYGFDPEVEGWQYDFFDRILRDRRTISQEIRLSHEDQAVKLVAGLYHKELLENDDAVGYLFGGDESALNSEFLLRNASTYGQIEYTTPFKLIFSSNFRLGIRSTDYSDDLGTRFDIKDRLLGGRVSLLYPISQRQRIFTSLARGFKAGGINQHPRIREEHRPFDPEYITNIELGYRSADVDGYLSIVGFHAQRQAQQVSISSQQDPGDPNSFTYYIGNAAGGELSGLELEFRRNLLPGLSTDLTIALLQAHTTAYDFEIGEGEFVTLGDRAPAYAPEYAYRLAVAYRSDAALSGSISLEGKDAFYYSDSHSERSGAYVLLNGNVDYEFSKTLSLSIWANNLLDQRYGVRGFFFGLEPPDYTPRLYESYGDPRHLGLTVRYLF